VLDVWQADADGLYSGSSGLPAGLQRGTVAAGTEGRFALRTTVPGAYTIPHQDPAGRLLAACGRRPWRPAHVHLIVSAGGHQPPTTQQCTDSSDYPGDDVAAAVKDSLIARPRRHGGQLAFGYGFRLAPARGGTGRLTIIAAIPSLRDRRPGGLSPWC
jgi:catechol 1,2-dioxygenase